MGNVKNCFFHQSEREQENVSSNLRSKSKISSNANRSVHEGKNKLARSASDLSEILKGRNTWTSQHPVYETSDDTTSSLVHCLILHTPCSLGLIICLFFSKYAFLPVFCACFLL